MAYPQTPLPVVVEMYLGSSLGWVDITDYVFSRSGGGISINHGFPDEGTLPEPSSMTMTLDNRTGDFTPRNPESQYYGLIGRNTPVRVKVDDELTGPSHVVIGPPTTNVPAGPKSNPVAITTGDIDIRVDLAMDRWEYLGAVLATQYTTLLDFRVWAFLVDSDGNLQFAWSTDGTSGTVTSATSTDTVSLVNGQRQAFRATLDVDDGGDHTVTFYTSDTIDGTWVQLGSAVTDSGTTSLYSGGTNIDIGNDSDFSTFEQTGKVYAFEARDGIDGTLAVSPDFASQDPGTIDAVDIDSAASLLWTVTNGAYITSPSVRYIGEISEWPTRWDPSEQDVWTEVTAQGILRRLGQGKKPARSPLRSSLTPFADNGTLAAYWAMENEPGPFGSAISGYPPMTYTGAAPGWGDQGDNAGIGPLLGSDRIPVLGSTTRLTGTVPTYTPSLAGNVIPFGCIIDAPPTTGWSDDTPIVHIYQSLSGSTVAAWELRYKSGSGGDLQLRALDAGGSQLAASGTLDFNIDGQQLYLGLEVEQDGSDVDWSVFVRYFDSDDELTQVGVAGTFSSLVVTTATQVQIAPTGGLSELAIGHVVLGAFLGFDTFAGTDTPSGLASFAGELAADRAARLADDIGVTTRLIGVSDEDSVAMGEQATPSTFIDAYNETWQADLALANETRDQLALAWRTRRSLYNQPIAATLDYTAAGEIAPDLAPTDDDRYVRNDIEVKRKNGSSYRVVDSTSRMGTQDPPDGVGPYEDQPEVNLYSDDQLEGQAHWRLHIGTWDEPRYPRVVVNMAALAAAGKTDLIAQVAALKVGDRIRLTNLPAFSGTPDTVDLMVLGFQPETLVHPTEWEITLVCVPYGPYNVGEYAATDVTAGEVSRYAPDDMDLHESVDSDDTTLYVRPRPDGADITDNATDVPSRWTTDAADFSPEMQVRIAGEVMSVSAVSNEPTFVAVGTAAHADNAGVTPGLPAGIQAGDGLFMLAACRSASSVAPSVSGWSQFLGQSSHVMLYRRTATGSDVDPTVTFSGTAAGDTVSAQICAFRGVTSDRAGFNGTSNNSSAQNINVAEFQVPTDVAVVLLCAWKQDDWTVNAQTPPAGFTEIDDPGSSLGSDQGIYWAYQIRTDRGLIPAGTITVTGGASAISRARMVAVQGLQALTVTRAVNGVVKSHSFNTPIELDKTPVYALGSVTGAGEIRAGKTIYAPRGTPKAGAIIREVGSHVDGDFVYPTQGLVLPGDSGDYASTPDTAVLDITGDIDIRAELTADWTPAVFSYVVSKYDTTGDQRSWALRLETDGGLVVAWASAGVAGLTMSSTASVPFTDGQRGAIGVKFDVDNGAGGRTARFYTAPCIEGPWTQLGSDAVGGATTSLHSGTAALTVSGRNDGTANPLAGTVHAVQVYDGIDGDIVVDAHFDEQPPGTSSFVDDTSLTWTVNGNAAIE